MIRKLKLKIQSDDVPADKSSNLSNNQSGNLYRDTPSEFGILRIEARGLSLAERIECEQRDTFFVSQANLWANLVLKLTEPARDGLEVELSKWICI